MIKDITALPDWAFQPKEPFKFKNAFKLGIAKTDAQIDAIAQSVADKYRAELGVLVPDLKADVVAALKEVR